ncbi:MAG TPA: RNA polymerase sigma factor [Rhodanobacteraceae bacterium]
MMWNQDESCDAGVDVTRFDEFARVQHPQLVSFLRRRTASQQDAEDAAQESLIRMLRYRDSEPASAWKRLLYRVAVNVAHDQFRKARNRQASRHVDVDECDVASPSRTPEEQAVYEQQMARLAQAIAALPPKCQRVYLLKRIHGLSHAQIARRCGISVKTVDKHLATALATLRRKVGNGTQGTSK